MQQSNQLFRLAIYLVATLSGAALNWTGISVVAVIYGLCFLREFVKLPLLAMSAADSGQRQTEYAGSYFAGIMLMFLLGFLANHYGWQHISAFLAQTFLRQ